MSRSVAMGQQDCVLERIELHGEVQGVGMRPHLYRLAQVYGLTGQVSNEGRAVHLLLQGEPHLIEAYLQQLQQALPPRARIEALLRQRIEDLITFSDFQISAAACVHQWPALMGDMATCEACVEELFDPSNRRHLYPFISCTDCGPRVSIQAQSPWDRAHTSMAAFTLCERCARDYAEPTNRRFHAQTLACADCGPSCYLTDSQGHLESTGDWLSRAIERLKRGDILAIKALGGFQLLCAADQEQAVARLRERKQRPHKPLALMVQNQAMADRYVQLSPMAEQWLKAPQAPVVLLPSVSEPPLAKAIAPGLPWLGIMLPSSPIHHLLARGFGGALVCTSGNRSGEPTVTDNDAALARLAGIADAFILHDREILTRIDDPVVQCIGDVPQVVRSGRGVTSLKLSTSHADSILAVGSHLKSTLALADATQVQLSPYIGDLDGPQVRDQFEAMAQRLTSLATRGLGRIAVDAHPDYWSRHWAEQFAQRRELAIDVVQHHHAHAVSVMLEHQLPLDARPQLAIVLDGLGMSEQGELWGGEFLLTDYLGYQRLAHFKPMPLPGAAAAMREPWRNLLAHVHELDTAASLFSPSQRVQCEHLKPLLAKPQHCPLASSAGRCFDAVAAALGLAPTRMSFEGEAAMRLEAAVCTAELANQCQGYPIRIDYLSGLPQLGLSSMWPLLLQDRARAVPIGHIAARFHLGLARAMAELAEGLIEQHNLPPQVLLSGGVFQNVVLSQLLDHFLVERRIRVLRNRKLPCHDGGIAAGQAASVWARVAHKSSGTSDENRSHDSSGCLPLSC